MSVVAHHGRLSDLSMLPKIERRTERRATKQASAMRTRFDCVAASQTPSSKRPTMSAINGTMAAPLKISVMKRLRTQPSPQTTRQTAEQRDTNTAPPKAPRSNISAVTTNGTSNIYVSAYALARSAPTPPPVAAAIKSPGSPISTPKKLPIDPAAETTKMAPSRAYLM